MNVKRLKQIAIIFMFTISACSQKQNHQNIAVSEKSVNVVRYGMITGVKPEKLEYYKQLHAHPWPQVIAKIKECNIHNYSIYLQKIGDKDYLFSYFEYTGKDFDADMKKMAADTTTQRWWKETDPCQLPLPEVAANTQIWTKMGEVFYTN
jgi:L-rhamnose mutarotase